MDNFVVRLPSLDGLMIGPFPSYEAAKAWFFDSVFGHHSYEILPLISPRKDHKKG